MPISRRARVGCLSLWSFLTCATWPDAAVAQPAAPSATTRLTSVAVEANAQGAVVTLTASGPLSPGEPQFVPGQPPRIYVDFAGLTPAVPGVTAGAGSVVRVRVAINNLAPLVSRVVVDLRERLTYRLDASASDRGIVRLVLGEGGSAPQPSGGNQTNRARPAQPGADGPRVTDGAGSPAGGGVSGGAAGSAATATRPSATTTSAGEASAEVRRAPLSNDARVSLALSLELDTRLPRPLPLVGGEPAAPPQRGRRRASGLEERQQRARAALAEARALHGQAQFEAAAEAAIRARDAMPDDGTANVVLGRAMLERYRETSDATHLSQALDALRAVDGVGLARNDQVDLALGLALGLYMSGEFRAAADVFATTLEMAEAADPALRDRAVDWWATALSRHAHTLAPPERVKLFEQMLATVNDEAKHDPGSTAAGYWAVVATRGTGDVDRAWDTAVAHWVRAQLCRDGGDALREDLDKLMATTIIPERARKVASGTADAAQSEAVLFTEWRQVKSKWDER